MASGGRWLVGVSGGGDSVALLRLLVELGFGGRLVIGHFNHAWSGWGAEAEAFVLELGRELGVEVLVGRGGGKAVSNAEARARRERREWMLAQVREHGLDGMVLAHTRTDVVESFLMRAGKGSGVTGLAGMKELAGVVGKRIWRPLLGVGRDDLRAYLRGLGQVWVEDPDNEGAGSQRAKIRKILPLLAEAGVGEEGMAASVAALARAEEALWRAADDFWRVHVNDRVGLSIDRVALLEAPLEVRSRVVAGVMRLAGDAGEEGMVVRAGKRLDLLARVAAEEAGVATLGGVRWEWDAASVRAEREADRS